VAWAQARVACLIFEGRTSLEGEGSSGSVLRPSTGKRGRETGETGPIAVRLFTHTRQPASALTRLVFHQANGLLAPHVAKVVPQGADISVQEHVRVEENDAGNGRAQELGSHELEEGVAPRVMVCRKPAQRLAMQLVVGGYCAKAQMCDVPAVKDGLQRWLWDKFHAKREIQRVCVRG